MNLKIHLHLKILMNHLNLKSHSILMYLKFLKYHLYRMHLMNLMNHLRLKILKILMYLKYLMYH